MPSSSSARITRTAISPRLATRTLVNTAARISVRTLSHVARAHRGLARLDLVLVVPVALPEVGQPHEDTPVLVLPDVAELVHDQVVGDGLERPLDEDQRADLVAAEAAQPRDAEKPRGVDDPDVAHV